MRRLRIPYQLEVYQHRAFQGGRLRDALEAQLLRSKQGDPLKDEEHRMEVRAAVLSARDEAGPRGTETILRRLRGTMPADDIEAFAAELPALAQAANNGELEATPAQLKSWTPQGEALCQAVDSASLSGGTGLGLLDRAGILMSHRDVGVGVSQVIPVIASAVAAEGRLIAIEQPEIHLHPALQAELGDLFIESALGERKNTFLIETHSEHLMLRILRRIREYAEGCLPEGMKAPRPEDVSVLYVHRPESATASEVIEVPIMDDGDFGALWPEGFFPERGKELF